ncbi:MAG: ABC transporter ATP-binding protein [Planctomycetaceae bacterium]|nr:ABC transporter ATP-binding protein [Planctomycetaceae bacterium]
MQEVRERRQKKREERAGVSDSADAPAINKPQHRGITRLVVQFWKLLEGNRGALIFALATLTVSTLLKLIPPFATKLAIDYIFVGKPLPDYLRVYSWIPVDPSRQLFWLGATVVTITVVESLVHVWGRWHATLVSKRLQTSVRRRVFEHSVRLPLHRVYQLKSGGVTSVLREDAGGIAELIFNMVYNPFRAVVQLVGSLVLLAIVDWRLLLGALALIPAVILTHRTWIGRIRPLYRDVRNQRQEIDSHATETFGGMRVVRAFARERSEAARYTRGTNFQARQELHVWWWARGVELVWEILLPAASAVLLWYGGTQVLRGELTLGDLMLFLIYLAMLLGPLAVLANSATAFQSNLAGLDRVLDLLEEPREMPDATGAIPLDPARVAGRVRLRGVGFHYPASQADVLHGVDLDVLPGQMVALVGPSGAGKTTLCNLVARFFDPTTGSIELDGIDLRQIRLESYRSLLGIVEQDVFLFDGTIAENIGYAVREASAEDVRNAARIANAHEFIERFELGYDTIIGERGVKLSGGQRQRLAIARAVLADPRILILDEATSNLDTESERLIQQSLGRLMQGRTSFVIAHRLSTIAHADRIVVLEGGRVSESGNHQELMANSGRYRHMVQLQLGTTLAQESV